MQPEDAATQLVPVKLTPRQLNAIRRIEGAPVSEWIRQAVEDRLLREVPDYGLYGETEDQGY